MDLYEKCRLVEEIFEELDREISEYKSSSGIFCPQNCGGECCNKDDICATVIEFIPLAFFLHNTQISEKIHNEAESKKDGLCVLYSQETGRCLFYEQRGLVCRLFGFSSIRDKTSRPQIVTCKRIKELYKESIQKNPCNIIMADYHRRLSLTDLRLGSGLLHINEAIKKAIEITGIFLKYR